MLETLKARIAEAREERREAGRLAEDLYLDSVHASGRLFETLEDQRADALQQVQDLGLEIRSLEYQLEAFRQGRKDAASGFEPDVDPRDCRPFDKGALAYCAGYQATRVATTAA